MINHRIFSLIFCLCTGFLLSAQEQLSIGGGFQTNANIFIRDTAIGAANIPQYDHQIFGAESWFNLNASYAGFNAGIRFDLFNNSNLLNPQGSYTANGIGRWFINKEIDKLEINVGHIYDQIGTGIIYRAYEERTQLIDNALMGAMLKYNINSNWNVRGFTGKQKNLFSTYRSILKGFAINGYYKASDTSSWSISPGFGFVNRTLDEDVVSELNVILSNYEPVDTFNPFYNSNAFSFFNTLTIKDFSWYIEAAVKPNDIVFDDNAIRTLPKGQTQLGKLVNKTGSCLYTSFGYTKGKLGITLEGKRTELMEFRSEPRPILTGNKGLITFIPPMAKINTYRMCSFYYPATQFGSEMGVQADIKYRLNRHWALGLNVSQIKDKNFDKEFYHEIYADVTYKQPGKMQVTAGVQQQLYNIELYYVHPGDPNVKTITPFTEILYKFNRKNSVRIEAQYLDTKEDQGSWSNLLVEFGFAPHWLLEASDMYNIKPTNDRNALHYPALGMAYTLGANRFALRYVKQVEGIVCSGGICRLEPAFSGIRATINSTF